MRKGVESDGPESTFNLKLNVSLKIIGSTLF